MEVLGGKGCMKGMILRDFYRARPCIGARRRLKPWTERSARCANTCAALRSRRCFHTAWLGMGPSAAGASRPCTPFATCSQSAHVACMALGVYFKMAFKRCAAAAGPECLAGHWCDVEACDGGLSLVPPDSTDAW